LFSAALIVLANIFSPVHRDGDGKSSVQAALKIMHFCGEEDPQARRYQTILESFFDALQQAEKDRDRTMYESSRSSDIFRILFEGEASNQNQAHINQPAAPFNLDAYPVDTFEGNQSDIWWGEGQDIYDSAGNFQVPLYGLMGTDML
jgi:hypothetical protein